MTLRTALAGAVIIFLGSLVHASPIDKDHPVEYVPFNTTTTMTLGEGKHEVYCDVNGYTYTNEGSGGSPLVSDCLQLNANIDKDGNWRVMEDTQHQIAQYKTCAYGVEPFNKPSLDIVVIGNGDIITTISESVKRFGGTGKVGASGTMWCQLVTDVVRNGNYAKIKFGIYHT